MTRAIAASAERRDVPRETDPLLEALVELARSAIANRRETEERRRTIHVVDGKRSGKAA
jgi:hypothetical protein